MAAGFASGRAAGTGGTAVRSAGFGGVTAGAGSGGWVRFCLRSITFASLDLFGLSSRLSSALLREETNPAAAVGSGSCEAGAGVAGGFSGSSERFGRGGGTGGAFSRCSLRGSIAGGTSECSSS